MKAFLRFCVVLICVFGSLALFHLFIIWYCTTWQIQFDPEAGVLYLIVAIAALVGAINLLAD
jgi:hypothetical protein